MTDPGMDLDARLEEYLRIRRSLGYKLERDGKLLAQFIAWLHEQHADAVTVEHAVAWVSLPGGGSGWLRLRMSVVRGFAAYLHTLDPAVPVPPAGSTAQFRGRHPAGLVPARRARVARPGRTPPRPAPGQRPAACGATMSALAPTLQAFFTDRLIRQRRASPHTIAAYRDTLRLLLVFTASAPAPRRPARVCRPRRRADRRVPRSPRTRPRQQRPHPQRPPGRDPLPVPVRRARHPEHAAVIARVLAIPARRADQALVSYLTEPELDTLLASPDRGTWTGRRDHALLLLAAQTGLRATELTSLDLRRPPPRRRRPCQLPWQGPEGPDHPAHRRHGRGPAGLDHRTRRRADRPAVPDPPWWPTVARRTRATRHPPRTDRRVRLPDPGHEEDHTARAAAHGGYLPWPQPGEGRGARGWPGTCLTSIRNSFVQVATFAT